MSMDTADLEMVAEQPEREPRGVVDIPYRSPDGTPGVAKTKPHLDDGTPFPTFFYLADPRLTAKASRLETIGVTKEVTARLENDAELAADYQYAHETFLAERNEVEDLGTDFSNSDMSTHAKCLHVLIAYTLTKGPDHFRLGIEPMALATGNEELRGAAIPASWPTIAKFGVAYPGVEG